MMNVDLQSNSSGTKRTVVIIVVILLLLCCCFTVLVGGWFLVKDGGDFLQDLGPVSIQRTPAPLQDATVEIFPTEVVDTPVPEEPTPGESNGTGYLDDFSDPESGWDTLEESDASIQYAEGGLLLQTHADSWVASAFNTDPIQDITLEVESKNFGGVSGNFYGIMCRMADYDNYYYGAISSDGYAGIGLYQDGDATLLGDGKIIFSDSIVQGGENLLQFTCSGNTLSLAVNGEEVLAVQDDTFTEGSFGLFLEAAEQEPSKVVFDNAVVTTLEQE